MKKSPTYFDIYSVTSKHVGDFFQIFEAFSENLNFNFLIRPNIKAIVYSLVTNRRLTKI